MKNADRAREKLVEGLESVAQGDRESLRRVYDSTAPKLFGICVHVLRDRALAEDVLQEVYLKVWQNAGAFDARRASPITWLCVLTRNTAIDWRRALARQDGAVSRMHDMDALHAPGVWDWRVEDGDWKNVLGKCLEELDDRPRSFIRAAFFEGFTHSELAARIDVPLGTLKSWIRRGLAQLKACIDHG
jgi:RNA polymerase sigma factor (sigma-70 family)